MDGIRGYTVHSNAGVPGNRSIHQRFFDTPGAEEIRTAYTNGAFQGVGSKVTFHGDNFVGNLDATLISQEPPIIGLGEEYATRSMLGSEPSAYINPVAQLITEHNGINAESAFRFLRNMVKP